MNRIAKTGAEWRQQLTDIQFGVTRQGKTEPPFSGIYWDTMTAGTYRCICCGTPLFVSDTKFDAGCGWPSFWQALPDAVFERVDRSHGMVRQEILCATCDAHLGHVFPDGPGSAGLRYCVNSASLNLQRDGD